MGRPHGLDGSFHVAQAQARLLVGPLWVDGEPHEVTRRAGTDQRPIIRLAGFEDRTAAEGLRGRELFVPRDAAPPLEDDEFWAADLEGCVVVDGSRPVGVVRRVLAYPSCELLEVAREDAGDLLVPLVRDAIREIDLEDRRVDIRLEFLEP